MESIIFAALVAYTGYYLANSFVFCGLNFNFFLNTLQPSLSEVIQLAEAETIRYHTDSKKSLA